MSVEIVSVGSSSSGNSYIIMAGKRVVILDAGLPCKKIMAALERVGAWPEDVDAVLVTHEHGDHVKSVRAVSRKCRNALFIASRGTAASAAAFEFVPAERMHTISAGDSVELIPADGELPCRAGSVNGGDSSLVISAFELSHDASEPTGFCVEYGGKKLAVVTDTGIITDEIYEAVKDSDMLVFEANHDEHMLMYGEYPYPLKMRIKGDQGHLSNAYAGEVLARMLEERKSGTEEDSAEEAAPLRIMLAHLSFHNNIPLFARQTVEDTLHRSGFIKGKDYVLDVAAKEGLTFMPGIGKREEQC